MFIDDGFIKELQAVHSRLPARGGLVNVRVLAKELGKTEIEVRRHLRILERAGFIKIYSTAPEAVFLSEIKEETVGAVELIRSSEFALVDKMQKYRARENIEQKEKEIRELRAQLKAANKEIANLMREIKSLKTTGKERSRRISD